MNPTSAQFPSPVLSKNSESETGRIPFFSIGIPTYDRIDLLKQCLLSVVRQTFTDFEVIVGNDYTKEPLCRNLVSMEDSRIRFVNHPRNLGEVGNMNSLLEMSRGRYFTWLFDDDLYAPDFLEAVYSALTMFNKPKCVYTSHRYIWGSSFPNVVKRSSWISRLFSGRQFLRMYLSGSLKLLGCCGVFETGYLRQIGGVTKLCDHPIGAHSEHLILVQAGLLDKIAYIDEPLVLYRNYGDSWSYKNKEADVYKQAGKNFVRKSIKVLAEPELEDDFGQNFSDILNLSANIVLGKLIARDKYLNKQELREYLLSLKEQIDIPRESPLYRTAMAGVERAEKKSRYIQKLKARFKTSAPGAIVKFAHFTRAFISRYKTIGSGR